MKTGELAYVEMGVKPILTQRFIKWLLSKGLEKQKVKSKNSSHTSYNYPPGHPERLTRPIMIREKYKEIPLLHIHTNLQTLGVSKADFEKEIQKF